MKKLFSIRSTAATFSLLLSLIILGHVFLPRLNQAQSGARLVDIALLVFVLISISRVLYISIVETTED